MKKMLLLSLLLAACDDHGHGHEGEVITTVILEVTPSGGAVQTFTFDDPDGDGGMPPTVDPVNLTAGMHALAIRFENRLETPAEDITTEVRDEGDQHQVFLTGTAVNGPATANASAPLLHAYADTDANGLPIGLANTITASAGTGELTVTLRHLPPVNDSPVKTASLAADVKAGGFAAIPGDSDVQVTFTVTVQ